MGVLRIIDYKTGHVQAGDLKGEDFQLLREQEKHKAIQVLLYSYLFSKNKKHSFSKPIIAGIYSFKNLNAGFLSYNFVPNSSRKSDPQITEERLVAFMEVIQGYITEIYNPTIPFVEIEQQTTR